MIEAWASLKGNLLTENRNGLIVNTEVLQANGAAGRDAALVMLEPVPGGNAPPWLAIKDMTPETSSPNAAT